MAIKNNEKPVQELLNHGFCYLENFILIQDLESPTISTDFFQYVKKEERREGLRKLAHGRKICLMFGECHGLVYQKLFSMCREFTENYALIDLPNVNAGALWKQNVLLEPEIYQECDVLIYNKVICEANKMLKYLPDSCQRISVTNARFNGYTPQMKEQRRKASWSSQIDMWHYIAWEDWYVEQMMMDGKTEDQIVEEVCTDEFLDRDYVEDWIENCLKTLRKAEKNADVKICDYLEKNCRKRWLYYNNTMPQNEVLEEIAKRILKQLGISRVEDVRSVDINFQLNSLECPVYPSVCKILGLDFSESVPKSYCNIGTVDLRSNYSGGGFTFEEAIRYYIRLRKGEIWKYERKNNRDCKANQSGINEIS